MKKTQIEHQPAAPTTQAALDAKQIRNRPDNQYLDALHINRRSRLTLLIQQRADGNAAAFAALLGYPKSQIHQFISRTYNGGRSIGERAARELEHRAALPFGWLDDVGSSSADGSSSCEIPAIAATPVAAPCFMPALYPREAYAGVVSHLGARVHLILLPGEAQIVGTPAAEEFAASVGGELPTHAEMTHLGKRMPQRFKPGLYYTCDKEEYDGDMATALWACGIDEGTSAVTRVRAVRRVLAEAAPANGALTAGQVVELATRLIDQESLTDDDDIKDDERMFSAGVKNGICRMAMATQKEIAARTRQEGGAR